MISALNEMVVIGQETGSGDLNDRETENLNMIREVERELEDARQTVETAGIPAEKLAARGQYTATRRIELLVDEGSFLPLSSLYDPHENEEGSVGVVIGFAQIGSRCVVVIASDNKVLAGAWLPGQEKKIFRAQDIAEQLRIPIMWILQCSGVKLTAQEKLYAGRDSGGRIFFRNAQLAQEGIPIVVGVFGTNPAGGGYHAISPAIIFAHKDANMAVGGAGIMGGMGPTSSFDVDSAEKIANSARELKQAPPGSAQLHYEDTGFIREVFETEEGVLEAMRSCASGLPAYDLDFFRVDEPAGPRFDASELDWLLPSNQQQVYKIEQVIGRLVDASEHFEYRENYGPEVYCGLVKLDGFLVGLVANRQGMMPKGYPAYSKEEYSIGGKLYREGLIKMSEFVTSCGRDKIPMVWLQDTSGIDVGDDAERAELLALGQALIYSIEDSGIPMATVVLRKGSAASHYIMGGPQGNRNNVLTLGTPATEIYVMHGQTAAVASFSSRLVRAQDEGKPLEPIVDAMNELTQKYHDDSRPLTIARQGFVDEIVALTGIREYLIAFVRGAYQNPSSFCPPHQMILPRIIVG